MEYPAGTITTEFGTNVPRLRIIRNDEVLFSGGYDPEASNAALKYFSEDGALDLMISISAHAYGDPWHNFEFGSPDIMRFSGTPETSVRGSWGMYFLALFATVIGALAVAFPETAFYLRHCLSVRDPEPTDLYYAGHKVASVLYVGLSLYLYISGLIQIV